MVKTKIIQQQALVFESCITHTQHLATIQATTSAQSNPNCCPSCLKLRTFSHHVHVRSHTRLSCGPYTLAIGSWLIASTDKAMSKPTTSAGVSPKTTTQSTTQGTTRAPRTPASFAPSASLPFPSHF